MRLIGEALAPTPVHVVVLEAVSVPFRNLGPENIPLSLLTIPQVHTRPQPAYYSEFTRNGARFVSLLLTQISLINCLGLPWVVEEVLGMGTGAENHTKPPTRGTRLHHHEPR